MFRDGLTSRIRSTHVYGDCSKRLYVCPVGLPALCGEGERCSHVGTDHGRCDVDVACFAQRLDLLAENGITDAL